MNAFPVARTLPQWEDSSAPGWLGDLDRVDPDGVIEGWCWCPDKPQARATIVIKLDGVPVASARSDTIRPDLAAAGMGDGAYGFLVIVPDNLARAGHDGCISLHDCETGRLLGTPRALRWRAHGNDMLRSIIENTAETTPLVEGHLDGVSSDGVVGGWCWHPLRPDTRINVTVAIDGHVVGTTRAAHARADLRKAGIGDGAHGFSFALSASLLASTGQITVSVADAATNQGFGVPCITRLGQLAATQDRLADIEHIIRRLGADLAAFLAEEALREARSPVTDLFATLGSLFQDMAQERRVPFAREAQQLPVHHPNSRNHRSVQDTRQNNETEILAPTLAVENPAPGNLVLTVPIHPKATLIVPVGADIAELRACLHHLHAQGTDQHAEIILLDRGISPEPARLHTTIRNLRIVVDQQADLPNWIARLSRPDVPIVFLAPVLRPQPFWLDRLLSAHEAHPNAAVIGGLVAGLHDGLLRSAGIDAGDGDIPRESGHLEMPDNPAYRCLRKVEAVSALGFLIAPDAIADTLHRRNSLDPQSLGQHALGSHSTAAPGLAEAVLHLCLRLREAGRDILVQPAAAAHCADGADLDPYLPEFGRSDAKLQKAWQARRPLTPPIARILVVVDHLPARICDAHPGPDSNFLLKLHAAAFAVTVAATSAVAQDTDAGWLESHGIAVFRPQETGSISALLLDQGTRFDMIAFMAERPPPVLIHRARLLAPQARIIQIGLGPDAVKKLTRRARAELCQIARPAGQQAAHDQRQGIALIADFTNPKNQATLRSLLTETMPRIRATHPHMRLHIVGEGSSHRLATHIAKGSDPDFVAVQSPHPITRLLRRVRIVLAPVHHDISNGRSLALSFAAGTPVIATSGSAAQLVKDIIATHDDCREWDTLSTAAMGRCRSEFSPDAAFWLCHDRAFHEDRLTPPC